MLTIYLYISFYILLQHISDRFRVHVSEMATTLVYINLRICTSDLTEPNIELWC